MTPEERLERQRARAADARAKKPAAAARKRAAEQRAIERVLTGLAARRRRLRVRAGLDVASLPSSGVSPVYTLGL